MLQKYFYPYKINKKGKIKDMETGETVETFISNRGYECVSLKDDFGNCKLATVHRLVAITFIPNPEAKPEVNHINGNKQDNCVKNLEWCTHEENIKHADLILNKIQRGEKSSRSTVTEETIRKICEMICDDIKPKEIMKKLNVSKDIVHHIMYKRRWVHVVNEYDFSNYSYFKPNKYVDEGKFVDHAILFNKTREEILDVLENEFNMSHKKANRLYLNRKHAKITLELT